MDGGEKDGGLENVCRRLVKSVVGFGWWTANGKINRERKYLLCPICKILHLSQGQREFSQGWKKGGAALLVLEKESINVL